MHALYTAVILVACLAPGPSREVDIAGEWDVAILGQRGTMRFGMSIVDDDGNLSVTLVAPNGEKRDATIALDGSAVTIRFGLDNPSGPVPVVMTGAAGANRMKGTADFGGLASADWTASRAQR